MSCYSPLHAFKGKSKESDKIAITFRRNESWRGVRLDLPCGQCVGCRLERSRQWAVRCMHEASLYDENSFLTLTYSEDNLPVNSSLDVSHYQDFMKRLRKSIAPRRVRYYHCGEYGEVCAKCGLSKMLCRDGYEPSIGRPHYHALLFGYASPDRKYFSERSGNRIYTSASMSKLWPYGHSVEGDVTFESAAYVARYVMKKVTGGKADDWYGLRKPEYTTMSRRPGIGARWYDRYKSDVYPLDRVVVNGKETRPPRFYDRLYEKDDRASFEAIKINREKDALHFVDDVLSSGRKIRVSDQDGRRLLVKEEVKRAEIATLKRPLEGAI